MMVEKTISQSKQVNNNTNKHTISPGGLDRCLK